MRARQVLAYSPPLRDGDYKDAFSLVDRDGDGMIQIGELRLVLWGAGYRLNEVCQLPPAL